MRAMRISIALFSLLSLVAIGCGDDTTKVTTDMGAVAQPDMTMGPDMTMRTPNGVVCGSATCAVGQECCVQADSSGTVTGETCQATTTACSGSAVQCDGAEDCSTGSSPYCCATITLKLPMDDGGTATFGGGAASCATSCDATVDTSNDQVHTRLCNANSDCTGETISLMGITVPATLTCCSSTNTPGLHFCGSELLNNVGNFNVTCS